MSGEEEASFGWLTLNSNRHSFSDEGSASFGSLDLGGASMQISFIPVHTHYVLEYYFPIVLDRTQGEGEKF